MQLSPLRLKKNEERRLRAGHVWVFSNEVDTKATPLKGFEAGQPVLIEAHNGKPVGTGYINPNSLICARLVSRNTDYILDRSLIIHRLNIALGLRERLYDTPHYRLVHGEGDGLPGLVVDRFGDIVVVQITTAGMEAVKDALIEALDKVLRPSAILIRNDGRMRKLEGLETYNECALGDEPEAMLVDESGVQFILPASGGQKTGWFYDQRDNRDRMQRYIQGGRVLDVFSYVGAWGIRAAMAGADEVICVDSSENALDIAGANAEANGVLDQLTGLHGDAFEALNMLRQEGERFDMVIVDPPAFIKRKKDYKEGLNGYRRINELAMRLLNKDGILIAASCSHHLPADDLSRVMLSGARHIDRELQILERGQQGPDHPIHPAIPETEYLKAWFSRILHP